MRDPVIVSYARTPIGKAYRAAFNDTQIPVLAAHALRAAVARARLEGGEIEDLTMGCALTQGTGGINAARHVVMAAGLPDGVAAATIDRQCASGLNALAIAASQIREGARVVAAGGMDSISLVQNEHWNGHRYRIRAVREGYYLPMLDTAEIVATACGISRAAQDDYALESQRRTAVAQAAVPQARVRPAPRSQVLSMMWSGATTWAIEILARSGKIGWFSSIGPMAARS